MGIFNRTKAQSYALKWALRENTAFASLDYFRGDCTNFVSQVMLAGGWTMKLPKLNFPVAWWSETDGSWEPGVTDKYITPYFSATWASASHFASFIETTKRASICARDDLDVGDVVQIAKYGDRIHHTMVVTSMKSGINGNEPNVSFHSRMAFNESLAYIEQKYAKGGNDMFLYWKIWDNFTY